jgi:metal-responsive CopG/Arc/MetJ family transcriptional regulator
MDRQKKESIVISVSLKQDMVNQIDELALKLGVKPNRLIRNFIDMGLDELRGLKKNGILEKGLFVLRFLEEH